jgi:hypothetical protein
MAGITSDPELTPKIKKLVDEVYSDLIKKWENKGKSQDLMCAGFEIFRNEMISRLKREKFNLSQRRK